MINAYHFTNNQQMLAHIRRQAEKEGTNTRVILEEYALDDFLRRVSVSDYKKNLILKGGFLLASVLGISNRTTEDIDTDIKNLNLTKNQVEKMIADICQEKPVPHDPITIKPTGKIEILHEGAAYRGFRVFLIATIYERSKAYIKIDISTGDVITPKEIKFSYPSLIDGQPINIMAYNYETIVAQKLETIFSRNIANTRMKDFYDLFILNKRFEDADYPNFKLNISLAKKALITTAKFRQSYDDIFEKIDNSQFLWQDTLNLIANDSQMKQRWRNFQKEKDYAQEISFSQTISTIKELMGKIILS